jgi:hypothetical protein
MGVRFQDPQAGTPDARAIHLPPLWRQMNGAIMIGGLMSPCVGTLAVIMGSSPGLVLISHISGIHRTSAVDHHVLDLGVAVFYHR